LGPNDFLIEACVESAEFAVAAARAGADRLELCDNLVEGGTTPSAGALAVALERTGIPVMAMIRPRGGDFVYSDVELDVMRRDVVMARELGAHGVVLGLLDRDGSVDRERTARLREVAGPLSVTFHRAFDVARDPFESLEMLVELGVDRVLTSGQRPTALEGLKLIGELARAAGRRIAILPGGGIRPTNVSQVLAVPGIREVHVYAARAYPSPMRHRNPSVVMGRRYEPDEYERNEWDPEAIRNLRRAGAAG
jgi:copper homeostasis protein